MKVKLLGLVAILLIGFNVAYATDESDLVGLGMPGALATKIATGMEDGVFSDDVTIGDDLTITSTTDIGWSVVAGANTACNTTCTNGCVFGVNTASATADIVACTDATADECLCAGSS